VESNIKPHFLRQDSRFPDKKYSHVCFMASTFDILTVVVKVQPREELIPILSYHLLTGEHNMSEKYCQTMQLEHPQC
jgi:hypothetical protein